LKFSSFVIWDWLHECKTISTNARSTVFMLCSLSMTEKRKKVFFSLFSQGWTICFILLDTKPFVYLTTAIQTNNFNLKASLAKVLFYLESNIIFFKPSRRKIIAYVLRCRFTVVSAALEKYIEERQT
jgi:hypothetical protein